MAKAKPIPETPELDRMGFVRDKSQAIGQFIEAMSEKGIVLCKRGAGDQMWPIDKSIEQILADHFDIDLKKVEKERRMLLEHLQS